MSQLQSPCSQPILSRSASGFLHFIENGPKFYLVFYSISNSHCQAHMNEYAKNPCLDIYMLLFVVYIQYIRCCSRLQNNLFMYIKCFNCSHHLTFCMQLCNHTTHRAVHYTKCIFNFSLTTCQISF